MFSRSYGATYSEIPKRVAQKRYFAVLRIKLILSIKLLQSFSALKLSDKAHAYIAPDAAIGWLKNAIL